jgi:uncharacterized protein (DUF1501 family)
MGITRRRFLGGSGATLVALGGSGLLPRMAAALGAEDTGNPASLRSLVVIQLAGGNDGLNTVVPYADPLYPKLRPAVALPESEILKLDERLGLHAALAPFRERFAQGTLAVVEGVGYPNPDRSHFVSTAVWQTARLDPYREPTGWLGRAIDFQPDPRHPREPAALEALGIGGGGLTPALYAPRTPVPSLLSLDAFSVQPDRRYPGDAGALRTALGAMYGESGEPAGAGFVRQVGRSALRSSDELRAAVAGYSSMVTYPRSGLSDQLKLIAQLLTANIGTRIFHVTLGGFDTHANQKPQQRNLLAQLADGVSAFLDDLRAHGLDERVAVITYSEFGRRAQENASAGTDHGAASSLFVVGAKVAGGLYGPAPDLSKLEGGDVPFAVDFRSVYASVLRDWFKIPAEKVLGPSFTGLQLFRA